MINEYLLTNIKTALEALSIESGSERIFDIFLEAGERDRIAASMYEERTAEEMTSHVFGTMSAEPSRLAPIKGVTVMTSTASLELLVEAAKDREAGEIGSFDEVAYILHLLTVYAQKNNGMTFQVVEQDGNEDSKSFTVTVNFSPPTCGELTFASSYFGELLPVRMAIYLTAVENGVSSNDVEITIDGHEVYFERAVLNRAKVIDSYTFGEGQSAQGTALQNAFSVDLICPLFSGDLKETYVNEVLLGSYNEAHTVRVTIAGISKSYSCIFGNSSAAVEPGKNVGVSVTLIERRA